MATHAWLGFCALLLPGLLSGCSSSKIDPRGTWQRQQAIFACDWEGGRNIGRMTFGSDGSFSEKARFDWTDRTFLTSASGRWSMDGDHLTITLKQISGRDEVAPDSEHLQLIFKAAYRDKMLALTLLTAVHDEASQNKFLKLIPEDELCTAVYQRLPDGE